MSGDATVDPSHDELAGVVDAFGGLTRAELERALSELAFRRDGQSLDEDALAATVEEAVDAYALVRYERDEGDPLLVSGPTAFPAVPEGAEDLPHILDVDRRDVDRAAVGRAAADRVATEADAAIADGDDERIERLLDVCYDLESWAPVDAGALRERLDDARDAGD